MSDPQQDPASTSSPSSSTATTPLSLRSKLRKIPRIPTRRRSSKHDQSENENEDEEEEEEEEEGDQNDGVLDPGNGERDSAEPILEPSSLGLNHIRTRSSHSPLRFTSLNYDAPPTTTTTTTTAASAAASGTSESNMSKIPITIPIKSVFSRHPAMLNSDQQIRTDLSLSV